MRPTSGTLRSALPGLGPGSLRKMATLSLVTAAAILSTGVDECKAKQPASSPPNIVVILADDLGYGDLGCYGHPDALPTPHLDRLAEQGMRLTDFHSSGNVCSPTRAGLLTGRYQQRAGVPGVINADPRHESHRWGLDPKEVTFPELLREAGYATAIFGKWHLGYTRNFNPVHHGFDEFRGYVSGNIDYQSHYDRMGTYDWWDGLKLVKEPGYTTHLITKHAVRFIRENKDWPFCVYVAHEAVHAPWQGPNDPPQRGPNRAPRARRLPMKVAFKAMMTELDKGVGDVVDAVDRAGIADRTLVFFFSDNGPAGGSAGPLRGRKGSDWEGGHRVPAIARWPGTIAAGVVNKSLTISLDLMPTMLKLADVKVPAGHQLDGVDLSPVLLENRHVSDRQLFWNGRAMRDGPWKLMWFDKANQGRLYNLDHDLGEQHDISDNHPERVRRMAAALADWRRDTNPKTSTPKKDTQK